jgi:SpoVK/Ycf46/Vps4 family AAA+-type ATPase
MERVDERVVIIATTNLFKYFDKAFIRRFDSVIDFNKYSRNDLLEISEILLNNTLSKYKHTGRNMRLFRKIISLMNTIPYPGELKNIIRTVVAFSNPDDEYDYLKRLYYIANGERTADINELYDQGFTIREIEILTGISKSQVARDLKES